MKKLFLLVLVILALGVTMIACAPAPEVPEPEAPVAEPADEPADEPEVEEVEEPAVEATGVTIEVATNVPGLQLEVLGEVIEEFIAETGINVEFSVPGDGYEALMRTRMATNDLPDVFSTHGWAVARYSPFLRPLNDQPWVSQLSPLIAPMITCADGNVYVIPVDKDVGGIVYNRDILASLDIDVDDLVTWSDFEEALVITRDAGYIPVFLGGADDWTIGQFFNSVAPSYFITNEAHNYQEELLNGTFDWELWAPLAEMFRDWNEAGFLNEDATTADYGTITRELGQGNVAFALFGNYAIADASAFGDANLGMMWIPALDPSDEPTLIAGERLAMGVWKDTPHEEEALMFLEFLARPDIMARLAEAGSMPAGFSGVYVDIGDVAQDIERYADLRTFPYFDRVFLPSGMWDDMCNTGIGILNGSMSIEDVIRIMEESYLEKMD